MGRCCKRHSHLPGLQPPAARGENGTNGRAAAAKERRRSESTKIRERERERESEKEEEHEHEHEHEHEDEDDEDQNGGGGDGNGGGTANAGSYVVLGYNDLGMHCMNQEFSRLCILPPFNNLHAQVIRRGKEPRIVTSGVDVTYRIQNNTHSVGKTNFWDWDLGLFGIDIARFNSAAMKAWVAIRPSLGLEDVRRVKAAAVAELAEKL